MLFRRTGTWGWMCSRLAGLILAAGACSAFAQEAAELPEPAVVVVKAGPLAVELQALD